MSHILISGLVNIETTLKIDGFPLNYYPVTYPLYGVNSSVSGVGYNIAKALKNLGDEPELLSLLGEDDEAVRIEEALKPLQIGTEHLVQNLRATPQSVILFDQSGRRQIHVDLKDIQETEYPFELARTAMEQCDIAALCNINFSRPLLQLAKAMGRLITTDVHVLGDINDDYNRDFLAAADILFLSDEHLGDDIEAFVRALAEEYKNQIIVLGRGSKGALLFVRDDRIWRYFPAVSTREVINTVGAGDALISCFLHYYAKDANPYVALERATLFASWKTGETGAAEGFLKEAELESMIARSDHTRRI